MAVNKKTKEIESKSADDIASQFYAFLKEKGMRRTPERCEVLNHALRFVKLFTIEDLRKSLQQANFRISLATLYNTVDLLVDANILRRMSSGNNSVAYERVDNVRFIHLLCLECGKVKLVKDTGFMAYMNARRFVAFTTSYYNLTVYGTCNDCARRIKRIKREMLKTQETKK